MHLHPPEWTDWNFAMRPFDCVRIIAHGRHITAACIMTSKDDKLPSTGSALAPLSRPVFRALWLALIVSSLGSFMHDVGAAWLMATMAPNPVMVSLVQAAAMSPVFLLTLPAGALADIVDRRRYLLTVQTWLMCTAGLLGVLTLSGQTTEGLLLGLTFAMGCGTAMLMPAFAAMIPDLVPTTELTAAVTLNSIAFNVTRAVGPAIAGGVVAALGPGIVFVVNSISFVAVMWVIYRWRHTRLAGSLPGERFLASIRGGLRYARQATSLHVILARGVAVFLCMSAPLAFLPLVVKQELGAGPQVYGLLLGCVGAGAVTAGLLLPRLRRRISADRVIALGSLGMALASLVLGNVRVIGWLCLGMALLGASWISAQSTLQVAAQLSLPNWVRARGLAMFIATFMGTMALGAASWGQVAHLTSIQTALDIAAAIGLAGILVTWPLRLSRYAPGDQSLADPVMEPTLTNPVEGEEGPVLVNVEYRIDAADTDAFLAAMQQVRRVRLRNGSAAWGIFQDTTDSQRFVEIFLDESWHAHLRQINRITREDRRTMDTALAYHRADGPPVMSHMIARRSAPAMANTL
jgi:MFS family permease